MRPRHLLLSLLGPPAHGRGCSGKVAPVQAEPTALRCPSWPTAHGWRGFPGVGGAAWLTAVSRTSGTVGRNPDSPGEGSAVQALVLFVRMRIPEPQPAV